MPDRKEYRYSYESSGDDHEMMTVPEVAEYCRVGERMVYRAIRAGQLPVLRYGANGRIFRVRRTELVALLNRKARTGEPVFDLRGDAPHIRVDRPIRQSVPMGYTDTPLPKGVPIA